MHGDRLLILSTLVLSACGGGSDSTVLKQEAIVLGTDDRTEYYEVANEGWRARVRESAVALVPRSRLHLLTGNAALTPTATWGESANLCAGERFAEQTAAAVCSAILLDWDLVLTAAHCVRAFAPSELSAVFGYYFEAPRVLALTEGDLLPVREIVAEQHSASDELRRLDFAWLRLGRAARPPRRPAPVFVRDPALASDGPIVAASTVGGVPFKLDGGGRVRDPRAATLDYFLADTDTSHGSSGGGAFDSNLALLGVLARGGEDFVNRHGDCATTRVEAGERTEEQFSYAHAAVAGLCEVKPESSTLCRPGCENPCEALLRKDRAPELQPSCAISARGSTHARGETWIARGWGLELAASLALLVLRRVKSQASDPVPRSLARRSRSRAGAPSTHTTR